MAYLGAAGGRRIDRVANRKCPVYHSLSLRVYQQVTLLFTNSSIHSNNEDNIECNSLLTTTINNTPRYDLTRPSDGPVESVDGATQLFSRRRSRETRESPTAAVAGVINQSDQIRSNPKRAAS